MAWVFSCRDLQIAEHSPATNPKRQYPASAFVVCQLQHLSLASYISIDCLRRHLPKPLCNNFNIVPAITLPSALPSAWPFQEATTIPLVVEVSLWTDCQCEGQGRCRMRSHTTWLRMLQARFLHAPVLLLSLPRMKRKNLLSFSNAARKSDINIDPSKSPFAYN